MLATGRTGRTRTLSGVLVLLGGIDPTEQLTALQPPFDDELEPKEIQQAIEGRTP